MVLEKILITCENYYPIGGGIQQYIRDFSKILIKRGIEVHIICQSYKGVPPEKELWGAKVHYSDMFTGSMRDPFQVINKQNEIAKFINDLNVDLIFANNHNSLAVIMASHHINIPVVYGFHGVGLLCPLKIRFLRPDDSLCYNQRGYLNCLKCHTMLKRLSFRKLLLSKYGWWILRRTILAVNKYNGAEKILSSANARIANSTMASKLFREKINTFGIPYLLEYEGKHGFYSVDPTSFKKKFNLDKYVLVPGRLHKTKGQVYAVKALKYLPTDIIMVFAGNASLWMGNKNELGAYAEEIKKYIERNGYEDRVVFTGRLEHDELRAAYSGALCSVIPSIWIETFGYVIIESLACETPVVVTKNCGAVECVDKTCAVIVKRKDPKAIADAIMKIPSKRDEMGKSGRKKLSEQFSPESLVNKTVSIFEGVLNGK